MDRQSTKYCKHCGQKILEEAVVCVHCGLQVEELKYSGGCRYNNNYGYVKKNKWTAFFLCLFFGFIGAHKFYEGKTGSGIGYMLTGGLFGIGVIVDLFTLLFKENPYYV